MSPYRKPKRIRTAFSPTQLLRLEHAFEKNHYVVGQERKDLASTLNLSETQVIPPYNNLHQLEPPTIFNVTVWMVTYWSRRSKFAVCSVTKHSLKILLKPISNNRDPVEMPLIVETAE